MSYEDYGSDVYGDNNDYDYDDLFGEESDEGVIDIKDDKLNMDILYNDEIVKVDEVVFKPGELNNTDDTSALKRKSYTIDEVPDKSNMTTRKKRKKRKQLPPKLEKIIDNLIKLKNKREKTSKIDNSVKRIIEIEQDCPEKAKNIKKRKHKKVFVHKDKPYPPSKELCDPIGFDDSTLKARLAASVKHDWEIKRNVKSVTYRYSPYLLNTDFNSDGCGSFYDNPTCLCCYWCTEPCNSVPVPMVESIVTRRGYTNIPLLSMNNTAEFFKVSGLYCSFNCMIAHANERYIPFHIIKRFLFKVYSIPYKVVIKPALPRYCLKKFGGQYTVDEYRATSQMGIKYNKISLPLIPVKAGIEEIESVNTIISERLGDIDKVVGRLESIFGSWGNKGTIELSKFR